MAIMAIFSLSAPSLYADDQYPEVSERKKSAGAHKWYIDPVKGNDKNQGTSADKAWKTATNVNKLILGPGDTIVVKPGEHPYSFVLMGEGTKKKPIAVRFMPGKHVFKHGELSTAQPQISNTNDAPHEDKAMALRLINTKNVKLVGKPNASFILLEGKAIYLCTDHAEGVNVQGLSFDYLHPTMGEFRVTKVKDNTMEATIPDGIQYRIEDGKLTWYGPGWEFGMGGYSKVFDSNTGTFTGGFSPEKTSIEELSPGKIKITYNEGEPQMKEGQSYQNRNTRRDCCGFFQYRSKNITWTNCNIFYMHGMGVVSQFSENITYDNLKIEPPAGSLRTIASWADNLHFSGCKGQILVQNCVLGSSHDDAINVHGTHLRIVGTPEPNKLVVRFMHNQTYGFDAFAVGDVIDYVSFDTLIPYATNKVTAVNPLNEKEIELTLAKPNPDNIKENDAVENVTWTAAVTVTNTVAKNIPTRGFLLTTRQPVLIERCRFEKTGMQGILVEDDASGWYESGVVRDMTITKNTFDHCGGAVIQIIPHAPNPQGEVHKNITISDNTFELGAMPAVRTKYTGNVTVRNNKFNKDGRSLSDKEAVDIQLP